MNLQETRSTYKDRITIHQTTTTRIFSSKSSGPLHLYFHQIQKITFKSALPTLLFQNGLHKKYPIYRKLTPSWAAMLELLSPRIPDLVTFPWTTSSTKFTKNRNPTTTNL
jgi:hypothetical protein